MYYANIDSKDKLISIDLCILTADEYGSTDVKNIEVPEEVYNNAMNYGTNYYTYSNGEIILNPNYEKEQEEKERERVGNLQCTKRVFMLMLQQLGITYSQVKVLIATNEQAQMEWELCVELQRKNPLLDVMASQFGITSKQLDDLFKFANGEITQEEFLGE